jgi:transcriptional regulator GlxA family with amidase domain
MSPESPTTTNDATLFEEVVRRSGLASWVGPGLLRRALQAVGVDEVGAARTEHFKRALPQLEARMAVYLKPEELAQRVASIRRLLETC